MQDKFLHQNTQENIQSDEQDSVKQERSVARLKLMYAINTSDNEAVQSILNQYNNQNEFIDNLNTPLLYSIDLNNLKAIQILLDKQADVFQSNRYGRTAIWDVVRHDRQEVAKLLFDSLSADDLQKAQKITYGPSKDSLMHVAAKYASGEMMQILLKFGFSPNEQNAEGKTPVHCLGYQNDKRKAKVFLRQADKYGIDMTIRDNCGKLPERECFDDVAKMVHRARKNQILKRRKEFLHQRHMDCLEEQKNRRKSRIDSRAQRAYLENVRLQRGNG